MAKIKVHNLASEVGLTNRDIIDYLTGKGYELVTAVSAVPESEVAVIRAKYGKAAPAPEMTESAQAQSEEKTAEKEAAPAQGEADKPKKKSGIVRVVRQQNATRQLQQRRPRKPAEAPKTERAASPVKEETPARSIESLVPQESAPDVTGKSAEREEALAPAQSAAPEAAKKAESAQTAPKKGAGAEEKVSPVKSETKAEPEKAAEAVKKAEPPKKAEAEKQEEKAQAAEEAKPAAPEAAAKPEKKTAPVETARDEKESAAKKPEETAAAPAEKDTGFRNGRVLRSYGAAVAQQMNSRPSRGSASGQGRNNQSRGGQTGTRSASPRTGERSFGQNRQGGNASGRGTFGGNRTGDRNFAGNGAARSGQGAGRGAAPGRAGQMRNGQPSSFAAGRAARPAAGGDGALAHKTTRDFRKDGKDRERNREERRELGHGRGEAAGRAGQGGRKQFSRVPKALQNRTPGAPQKKEEVVITEIRVPERITVRDLAEKMHIPGAQIVKELFMKGEMVTLNHELPYEKAEEIALEHDIICEKEEREDVIGALLAEEAEDEADMTDRPPVVCVMGHVDHGKTSLLDAIRDTHVTDKEAGGITQHIGAYMVQINGKKITFLDTPGHEAFTAMRMRGANATDIAVLVVAADDGVMPQTVEAINHAKAADVEIIVAVNKIDKPGANVDRVKQELSEYGLIAEDWGGSTVFCPVSAKTREGLDDLLEMILTVSEMHELKANPNRKARGIVLEAKLDKGRGPVASILIQKGTLHQGDFIACGAASGKVRAMTDEKGRRLQKATPSMPVEIIGLSSVPEAGEVLVSLDSDKEAKEFAAVFVSENKKTLLEETKTQMSLDDLFNQIKEGSLKELPIVVKADVQGSVEAVSQSLLKLSNEEVVVKVIHGGVGAINESDVSLASASNAIIIGFNVRPDNTAKMMAENQKVDIHLYNVIYEAIEEVERALKGMRAAVYEEKVQGHAEIRQIFKASGVGNIAGAYVKDGIITRSSKVRVFRGEEKLFEGDLSSLKRFKDDVKEVREGFECGLVFDGFGDFEELDMVEAYTMVEVPRE